MSYAADLLELAKHLADVVPVNGSQAYSRRAVSTAYYALFHLLISEATLNWSRPEFRSRLGRLFEHGRMGNASTQVGSLLREEFGKTLTSREDETISAHLRVVADTFIQVQQERNSADYDTAKEWSQTDVLKQIDAVSAAFESWQLIRDEPVAQAFLVSLLGKRARPEQ